MHIVDRETEAAVRHLRTLLSEVRGLIRSSGDERAARLYRDVARAQHEAELFAPDFHSEILRNGASGG